jgi:DUF177 domain-containing protein
VKVTVVEIKEKPLELSAEEAVAGFPALMAMEQAGECSFLTPIRSTLTVVRGFDHIRTEGRVATTVRLSCSRCLADYEAAIDSPFTIFYTKSSGIPLDEEVELEEEDLISVEYSGDEIDFAPLVAEQVIMGIPLKPLCREECQGLCSRCGADLNIAPCGCDRTAVNLKFSALQNLKIEK